MPEFTLWYNNFALYLPTYPGTDHDRLNNVSLYGASRVIIYACHTTIVGDNAFISAHKSLSGYFSAQSLFC